jgi:hypothetical protein
MSLKPKHFGCIAIFFVFSCASERKITYDTKIGLDNSEKILAKWASDVKYVTASDGSVVPDSGNRSRYESKGLYSGATAVQGEQYGKENYRSKRWGGNNEFSKQAYNGGKNGNQFKQSPHFVRQQANAQGDYASVGDRKVEAQNFTGYTQNSNNGRALARPVDAQSKSERENHTPPPVYDLDTYNNIGVEETRSLLGR